MRNRRTGGHVIEGQRLPSGEAKTLVTYNYALKTLGERLGLGFHPPRLGMKAGQRILKMETANHG
jgi:hypothetical protein